MKIRKRITALFSAVVMAASMLSIEASATGSVNYSYSGSTSTSVCYSFANVDGTNFGSGSNYGVHLGQKSTVRFSVPSTQYYTVSFPGTTGSGAKVRICIYGSEFYVSEVSIPLQSPGMTTVSTPVYIPAGQYYIKVSSTSTTTKTAGSITFYGVTKVN